MKTILCTQESKIFERIIRALDGRLFCVRFVMVERDGVLRGRIISCEQIGNLPSLCPFSKGKCRVREAKGFWRRGLKGVVAKGKKGFYLPILKLHQAVKDKGLRIKDLYFSPYFNKFDFLTVIKIRAPARSV